MCDAVLERKTGPGEPMHWDWFTGWLDRTYHYCPKHKRTREHDEMLKLSRIKPDAPLQEQGIKDQP